MLPYAGPPLVLNVNLFVCCLRLRSRYSFLLPLLYSITLTNNANKNNSTKFAESRPIPYLGRSLFLNRENGDPRNRPRPNYSALVTGGKKRHATPSKKDIIDTKKLLIVSISFSKQNSPLQKLLAIKDIFSKLYL